MFVEGSEELFEEDASGCFLSQMHCRKIPRERLQCSLEKAEFALGVKGL